MPEDNALLRQFAEDKSEAAFAALVQRHLPMIYAAACRQIGDTHRAQEIALAAFSLLARKAGSLLDHPSVGGWLYTTVAHLADRTRRTEARRIRREQEAHAMHETNTSDEAIPEELFRPLVDELLLTLPERDRLVVLLRFFENQPYAEIGARLGLGENAARMRVDRALERLRVELGRRGVGSTATALATALAAQASVTPPAGLAASIVTSAAATATAAGGGLLFLMNTSIMKTGLLAAAVALGAGGLLWQHFENIRLREELAALKASRSAVAGRPAATATLEPAPADTDFLRLSNQVAALRNAPAATWQERADTLQELMAQLPEMQIPELALARPEDWLDATKTPLQSDADYRRALAQVRTSVVNRFVQESFKGVRAYLQQHPTLPADPTLLESYFTNPVGPEVWAHYKVVPADSIPSLGFSGNSIVTLKSPVDPTYDTLFAIGKDGFGFTDYRSLTIRPVAIAYDAANPGKPPGSPADLLPYATTNAQRAAIRAAMTQKD